MISFGCELFFSASSSVRNKLEKAFNDSARYVYWLKKYDHLSDYKNMILEYSLRKYLIFRKLLLLNKINNTAETEYLFSKLKINKSART